MRCINEPISRRANAEDNCTGAFWESRYKSQALLDEHAILSCMAYVDLNPVRAKIATTPEESEHTSIKKRIASAKVGCIPVELLRFQGDEHKDKPSGTPFSLDPYIQLVDWIARIIRRGKSGVLDDVLPPILQRLDIGTDTWLTITTEFEDQFRQWVGTEAAIQITATHVGKTRSRSPPMRFG
ncbi:hypothetical protein AB833_28520 [Chromatiales bacterium (ex Bugula neritina AB1)]|nr:hypothetical protein AB833_28520 [Chromatiales bacterium (ex Bugula neritina AB1)]